MSYHRDFTIGKRETLDFYLSLVLRRWRGGIAGFAAAGALASLLYTARLSLPARIGLAAAGAAAFALLATLWLLLSTGHKVREQLRRSGRESYIQETEINGGRRRRRFTSSSPTPTPGSFPRRRWRTRRRTPPSCGSCSPPFWSAKSCA